MSMSWTKRERAAAYLVPRLNLKLVVVTSREWKVTKYNMKKYFTKVTVTCKAFCQKRMHTSSHQNQIQIKMIQLLTLVEELFLIIVIPVTVLMMMMNLMVVVVLEIEDIEQAAVKASAILGFITVNKCYEKYCSEELTDSVLCSLYPNELTLATD